MGRHDEVQRVLRAFAAAHADRTTATMLVAGDAGVGKTRFVGEVSELVAARGGRTVSGACLELVDRALPYAPVVEILRQLTRTLDPTELDEVLGDARAELARLLPELGAAAPAVDAEVDQARLFEHVLALITRLGERVPTLVVVEDLHWADRSSLDLFVFLARNLRDARVVLVATFRSDDLHRRHPLRPVVMELERAGVVRIDLAPFSTEEVRDQVAAIIDGDPPADLVERIVVRSEGNAFFTEELLAAERDECCADELPRSVRDVVIARIDRLSAPAQQVLGLASVAGREVDHRLLVALADREESELDAPIRELVANQVLVPTASGVSYAFRHALVQEAVYDDLLPGARVAAHARLATLLSDHPELFGGSPAALAGELACHWHSARDAPRAFVAALDAARAAHEMYAYPESLAHFERALELWQQVPDAAERAGQTHVELLERAALAAEHSGPIDRALAYIQAALDEVDEEAAPVVAGLLHERAGRYIWMVGRPPDEAIPENELAVRLVPSDPPTEARARVLATLGQQLMLADRDAEAIGWCEEAIAVAQAVGNCALEGHARNTLGTVLGHLGDLDASLEQLQRARDLAREQRSWIDLARAAVNESGVLEAYGRFADAVTVARRGAEEAVQHGLSLSYGAFLRLNASDALFELGRWDEVEQELDSVEGVARLVGVDAQRYHQRRAMLLFARGDTDGGRRHLDAAAANSGGATGAMPIWSVELAAAHAELLLATGHPEAVPPLVMSVWERRRSVGGSGIFVCALLASGMGVAADLAVAARRARDPEREAAALALAKAQLQALDEVDGADASLSGRTHVHDVAIATLARLEFARAEGHDDADGWDDLAEEWAAQQRLPRLAYARFRQAEATLGAGQHAARAAAALREAHALTATMRYATLLRRVEDLARRARVALPSRPDGDGAGDADVAVALDRLGLTDREREVLGLVAQGRTNRQIAETLFISVKTASVHVSNILGKLGVANRGEAAAAAHRLGIGSADHL
ncbi:MAG TPA: AAA family ATPase [Acidimicrobiia bacterium]|nr:AAA family ATPase [Acidimicrobiia bacterium]